MKRRGGGHQIGRPIGNMRRVPLWQRPRQEDDDFIFPTYLGIGQAHGIAPPDDEPSDPAAVLWVPDPEQRRGWRERYIAKPSEPKPGARPIGFRKP